MKRLALIFTLVLAGCAVLGLEQSKSFGDRLAYAEGLNTALRDASSDSLAHHEISSQDMEHVILINSRAKELLLTARTLKDTDPSTAEAKLVLATTLLTDLQNYLRVKGVKTTMYEPGGVQWAKLHLHS